MKGPDNQLYVTLLVISNIVARLQVIAAIKWPRVPRPSFFLLFAWASWTNWTESQRSPKFYLEYAGLTWSNWYQNFIEGWFAGHIQLAVGLIATCEGLIAISMLLKGWIYKIGSVGAIIFLLSIFAFWCRIRFSMHSNYGNGVIYFVKKTS